MVSIIIPTFNRCNQLNRTLFYLSQLKTDKNLFEIIVIDNGSSDTTKFIVENYQRTNEKSNLSYYYDAEPGLLTGRHFGASKAKGEILTFIDDDIHVTEKWLDAIIYVMNANANVAFLTGPNLPKYESYPPDWLNYFWKNEKNGKSCSWLSLLDLGSKVQEISPNYVWGLNFTIRKKVFLELGGFHPDCIPSELQMFQGDGETGLTMKAIEKGLMAMYHPDVMIYHEVPSERLTFEYFEKRAFYSGVCDSFYNLRMINNLYTIKPFKEKKKLSFYLKLKGDLKKRVKRFFFQHKQNPTPKEIITFMNNLESKQKEGFNFHQKYFNEDSEIRKWVLKKDYFSYKLPTK